MFSLINLIAVSTQKSSSLHTIILKTKHKQSSTLSCITITYNFLHKEIRYFILLAINTHIDCSNNSKCSVRCIFKATARSLESVTLSNFCYGLHPRSSKTALMLACILPALGKINRKISMIFPLVSCCSCVNKPSSS